MNKFDKAWEYLKKNEGGFSNDSADRGGATNLGISLKFLKGIKKIEADINQDGKVDYRDILAITEEKAKEIYRNYFWIPARIAFVKEDRLAMKIFDVCVNFGVRSGIILLQKSINKMYEREYLTVDGIVGPKTLEAVNNASWRQVAKYLVRLCEARYRTIAKRNPTQERFLNGWLIRARRLPR